MRVLVFSSWQARRPRGLAAPSVAKVSRVIAGRPNPSVKGTSPSGLRPLAAAPYVER
jgi:hypothetical protein